MQIEGQDGTREDKRREGKRRQGKRTSYFDTVCSWSTDMI